MEKFEQEAESASARHEIPGAVVVATDKFGDFYYSNAFGKRSVRVGADQSPLTLDSIMRIASCTKLVTAIAALQCVDRGLLHLDKPIYNVLPELSRKPILKRWRWNKSNYQAVPVMKPHKKKLTLRHLLTHTSGLAAWSHPDLVRWLKWHRIAAEAAPSVERRHNPPLVFEPGESWFSGPGIDWAGVAVERVTGRDLQCWCEEHIFKPVGAEDVVFTPYLCKRPDLEERVVDMSIRDPENPARSSSADFHKILHGVLNSGKAGSLLDKWTYNELFRPCLGRAPKMALNCFFDQEENGALGNIPRSVTKNWAIGGVINEQDLPDGRKAGTMTWIGSPNLYWWIDRESGLCAYYATQIYRPADEPTSRLVHLFEKGLYETYSLEEAWNELLLMAL
ncbi:beta-lactamase/transpeptidase-like protein [Xylariaceae sp. FL0255]|nr:beta-lactamase/transpeptidase-like protein [Xylariaceae sp. FL0255]